MSTPHWAATAATKQDDPTSWGVDDALWATLEPISTPPSFCYQMHGNGYAPDFSAHPFPSPTNHPPRRSIAQGSLMLASGRAVTRCPRIAWLTIIGLVIALTTVPTAPLASAAQPANPSTAKGAITPAELPAMMLTPADLDAAGLPGAGIGGGQTFSSLDDAAASRMFAQSRGIFRLSAVPNSRRILANAGWQRFHEHRIGTSRPGKSNVFAFEVDSGVERFATAAGAADAFAFYTDLPVAMRIVPVENLPVDNPPAIGDETALWQIRGKTAGTTRTPYRGLSLWFRTGSLIASVAAFDFDSKTGSLPSQQLVAALGQRLLARIEEVRRHGGPGLGDRVLRLGGPAVAITTDQYLVMNGEVLPLLGGSADGLARATKVRDQFDMTDQYYVFSEISSSGATSSDRTFSIVLTRFANATGAGGYFASLPSRLRGADVNDLAFPADAPALGDETHAATYAAIGSDGRNRRYVDLLVRVDRQVIRLRIASPQQMDWSPAQSLAAQQIACLQTEVCLDAIPPPVELCTSARCRPPATPSATRLGAGWSKVGHSWSTGSGTCSSGGRSRAITTSTSSTWPPCSSSAESSAMPARVQDGV